VPAVFPDVVRVTVLMWLERHDVEIFIGWIAVGVLGWLLH
jgi:hypothetical protein